MAGIRILFKLLHSPAVPRAPYSGQYCGLTTSATTESAGGDTYAPGYIVAASAGNSMDISRGQGSLAEAIEASISVADTTDSGLLLSKAIYDGDLSFAGATVWIDYAHGGSAEVSELVQATIVGDPEYSPGVVTFKLKSATYTTGRTVLNRFSFPEIPTKPADASAPSDPAYPLDSANHIKTPAYSGECYGGIPVSLKAGKGPDVQLLSRWKDSALKTGDISTTSDSVNPADIGDIAFEISQIGSIAQSGEYYTDSANDGKLKFAASILFKCRTSTNEFDESDTEASDQFASVIHEYIENGYRIVLSDGQWFCDITAYTHSPEPVLFVHGWRGTNPDFATYGFAVARTTKGMHDTYPDVEYPMAGVLFNLCDANGSELFADLPSAESVKVYAVPASINVSTGDKILLGVARNQKTAAANFPQEMCSGSTLAIPSCADASGFVVPESIPCKVMAYTADLPWSGNRPSAYVNRRGFVMWEGDFITSGTSAGDLGDINTDPDSPRGVDAIEAISTRTIDDWLMPFGWIDLRIQSDEWGDLNCVSVTARVTQRDLWGSFAFPETLVKMLPYFRGPYSKRKTWLPVEQNLDVVLKAPTVPSAPDWNSSFTNEPDAIQRVEVGAVNGRPTMAPTIGFGIRDVFAWRFNRLSFSEIYGTVWPFWTREYYVGAWSNAWGGFDTGSYIVAVSNSTEYAACRLTDAGEEWAKFQLPGDLNRKSIIGGGYDLATLTFFVIWRQQLDDTGTSWRVGFESLDAAGAWVSTTTHDLTGSTPTSAWIGNGEIHFSIGSTVLRWSVAGGAVISSVSFGASINGGHFNGSIWLFASDIGVWYALADFSGLTSIALADHITAVAYGGLTWCAVGYDGAVYTAQVATAATPPSTGWAKVFGAANIPDRYSAKEPGFLDVSWDGVKFVAIGGYYRGYSSGGSIMATGGAGAWSYVDQDAGAWLSGITWCRSKWLVVGDATASFADYTLQFSPGRTPSPLTFLQKFKVDFFGGEQLDSYNPLRWSGADGLTWAPDATPFAIAFDPPDAAAEPPTPESAVEKICNEWWIFAGEHCGDIDASNDPIEVAFPRITPGRLEDIATTLFFSYAPFGGEYLKTAYVQNVDVAYVAGNDSYYFGGWDDSGNTYGLEIWSACRAAYLATGSPRRLTRSFDSVHTAKTMGALFTHVDADLGRRIDWICRQPRYLTLRIDGNESKAGYSITSHRAFCGCRYRPNQTIMAGLGLALPERGIVTKVEHDYITGAHEIQIAFAPEVPE